MGPDSSGVLGMPFRRTGHFDRQLVGVSRFGARCLQVVLSHGFGVWSAGRGACGNEALRGGAPSRRRIRLRRLSRVPAHLSARESPGLLAEGVAAGWRDARQRRATMAFRGPQGPSSRRHRVLRKALVLARRRPHQRAPGRVTGRIERRPDGHASGNRVVSTRVAGGFEDAASSSGNLVRGSAARIERLAV